MTPNKPTQDSVTHSKCPTSDCYTKPAQTPEITIKYTFKPTYNLFTYSAWLTSKTANVCSKLSIYTYGMGVGPAWVCDGLSDVQTDVQNVPIDSDSQIPNYL